MTQQDWEDMEGSREGALWLEFLTWVGGQRDTGTGGVTAGVGWGAGVNSLQEIVGCEIQEDNHAWGFRLLYQDGELFLSCHLETHRCTVP